MTPRAATVNGVHFLWSRAVVLWPARLVVGAGPSDSAIMAPRTCPEAR